MSRRPHQRRHDRQGQQRCDLSGAVHLEKINGEWKLRNVIINGINIGKLFRDQFADAMQRNGNDLDKTIDGWAGEVAKAKEATDNSPRSQQMSEAAFAWRAGVLLSGVLDYRSGPACASRARR
jgi:hypothetical protein